MGSLLGALWPPMMVWGWGTEQVYKSERGKMTGLKDEEEVMVVEDDAKFNFRLSCFLVMI